MKDILKRLRKEFPDIKPEVLAMVIDALKDPRIQYALGKKYATIRAENGAEIDKEKTELELKFAACKAMCEDREKIAELEQALLKIKLEQINRREKKRELAEAGSDKEELESKAHGIEKDRIKHTQGWFAEPRQEADSLAGNSSPANKKRKT